MDDVILVNTKRFGGLRLLQFEDVARNLQVFIRETITETLCSGFFKGDPIGVSLCAKGVNVRKCVSVYRKARCEYCC